MQSTLRDTRNMDASIVSAVGEWDFLKDSLWNLKAANVNVRNLYGAFLPDS